MKSSGGVRRRGPASWRRPSRTTRSATSSRRPPLRSGIGRGSTPQPPTTERRGRMPPSTTERPFKPSSSTPKTRRRWRRRWPRRPRRSGGRQRSVSRRRVATSRCGASRSHRHHQRGWPRHRKVSCWTSTNGWRWLSTRP